MTILVLHPFENETQSIQIDELTIENRLDRIELYGALVITRDQIGLQRALEIQTLINATVQSLQAQTDLPHALVIKPSETIDNPFK
ncbi:MAG: hypothetical protein RI984_1465 [Pseudomonadota bacterium]|jgi:hypothetical protein